MEPPEEAEPPEAEEAVQTLRPLIRAAEGGGAAEQHALRLAVEITQLRKSLAVLKAQHAAERAELIAQLKAQHAAERAELVAQLAAQREKLALGPSDDTRALDFELPPGYESGALRAATMSGDSDAVAEFLEAGVDPNDVRELLANWTPLHYAAQLGHVEIINLLLDHGAKPAPVDTFRLTPLMQAGYWGQRAAVRALTERGGGSREDVPSCMVVEEIPKLDAWLATNGLQDMKRALVESGVMEARDPVCRVVQMLKHPEAKTTLFANLFFQKQDSVDVTRGVAVRHEGRIGVVACDNRDGFVDVDFGPSGMMQYIQAEMLEAGNIVEDVELQAKFDDAVQAISARVKYEQELSRWHAEGHVTIICSAPEFSLSGDKVMVALFALCDMNHTRVKFGYDWGGSSTAEPADKDPERLVRSCCHSLACSCDHRSANWIKGPVDWSNPKSVAGSMWFPKYITKVQTSIVLEAQRGTKFIEMLAIRGGPVTQLEHRTMPYIVAGAVEDLRSKGVSISLLESGETTDLKLYLRMVEYDEFLRRFYDTVPLSASGMCLAAEAKISANELTACNPAALMQVKGFTEQDKLAVLKQHQYKDLPLSDAGMLIAATATKTAGELTAGSPGAGGVEYAKVTSNFAASDLASRAEEAEYLQKQYITISVGDVVMVTGKPRHGWWEGHHEDEFSSRSVLKRNGRRFPASSVELIAGPDALMQTEGLSEQEKLAVLKRHQYKDLPLSDAGMLIAATAKKTADELTASSPAALMQIEGLSEQEKLAVLQQHQYKDLPLSDAGILILARIGRTQQDIIEMEPASVLECGLTDKDSACVLRVYQYPGLPLSDLGMLKMAELGATVKTLSAQQVLEMQLDDADSVAILKMFVYKEVPLSDAGILILARIGRTRQDIIEMEPASVLECGLTDKDSACVLRMYQYPGLPLSDLGMLTVAKAGRTLSDLSVMDDGELSLLKLCREDSVAMKERPAEGCDGWRAGVTAKEKLWWTNYLSNTLVEKEAVVVIDCCISWGQGTCGQWAVGIASEDSPREVFSPSVAGHGEAFYTPGLHHTVDWMKLHTADVQLALAAVPIGTGAAGACALAEELFDAVPCLHGVCIAPQEVLQMLGTGRSTGLVLNVGIDVHVCAIYQEYVLAETVRTLPGKGQHAKNLETEEACRAWLADDVVELIAAAVATAPFDTRRDLLSNIVVTGGNSPFVDERTRSIIQAMVADTVQRTTSKDCEADACGPPGVGPIKVAILSVGDSVSACRRLGWVGGSVVASLSTSYSPKTLFVSRAQHMAYRVAGAGASLSQMSTWRWPSPIQPEPGRSVAEERLMQMERPTAADKLAWVDPNLVAGSRYGPLFKAMVGIRWDDDREWLNTPT